MVFTNVFVLTTNVRPKGRGTLVSRKGSSNSVGAPRDDHSSGFNFETMGVSHSPFQHQFPFPEYEVTRLFSDDLPCRLCETCEYRLLVKTLDQKF